jgi:hypothetical protein
MMVSHSLKSVTHHLIVQVIFWNDCVKYFISIHCDEMNLIHFIVYNCLRLFTFNFKITCLTIELPILSFKYLNYNEQIYNFVNCDYNCIRSNLASLDRNGKFNGLDINNAVNAFYENVFKIINTYCPVKTLYFSRYPHWFSHTLKKLNFDKKNSSQSI